VLISAKKVGKKVCKKTKKGKNSIQTRCCIYKGHKRVGCEFVGEPSKIVHVMKCKWSKKSKNQRQRICCSHKKITTGLLVKRTKPKCHYVGIKISSIKLKYGCSFRRFGKYGRRKFCCDTKRHCNGVKCYNKRKCKFVGTIFTRRQNIKCRFVQKKTIQ